MVQNTLNAPTHFHTYCFHNFFEQDKQRGSMKSGSQQHNLNSRQNCRKPVSNKVVVIIFMQIQLVKVKRLIKLF